MREKAIVSQKAERAAGDTAVADDMPQIRKSGPLIRYAANILTALRIVFSLAMLLTAPFSAAFWLCYLCCGVSDIIDGPVARRLGQASAAGARLDSAADLAFAAALAAVLILNADIPAWMWTGAASIALLRFIGYGIGFRKYRAFSSLHTYANKAVGGLIFASPLLYIALGLTATGALLFAAALLASLEELIITIKSERLDRDCKSLWLK